VLRRYGLSLEMNNAVRRALENGKVYSLGIKLDRDAVAVEPPTPMLVAIASSLALNQGRAFQQAAMVGRSQQGATGRSANTCATPRLRRRMISAQQFW